VTLASLSLYGRSIILLRRPLTEVQSCLEIPWCNMPSMSSWHSTAEVTSIISIRFSIRLLPACIHFPLHSMAWLGRCLVPERRARAGRSRHCGRPYRVRLAWVNG